MQDIPAHHLRQRHGRELRRLLEAQIPAPRIGRFEVPILTREMRIEFPRDGLALLHGNIQRAVSQHDDAIAIGAQMHGIGAQPPILTGIARLPLTGDGGDGHIMAGCHLLVKQGEQALFQGLSRHRMPTGAA